jgi:hypothetical protein
MTSYTSYKHYFKQSDKAKDKAAFGVLRQPATPSDPVSYDITCEVDNICEGGQVALTNATPESFEIKEFYLYRGVRSMIVCPRLFEAQRTTSRLPTNDKEEKENCDNYQNKYIAHFETGGML